MWSVRYDIHTMPANSVQDILIDLVLFFNSVIIPGLFAIAFFFLIWNAARYFIFQGATEEGRASARRLLIYAVLALVVMISLWGIVRLVTATFGITSTNTPCPDFNPDCFDTFNTPPLPGNNGPLFN
jgi:hypothetical protein